MFGFHPNGAAPCFINLVTSLGHGKVGETSTSTETIGALEEHINTALFWVSLWSQS